MRAGVGAVQGDGWFTRWRDRVAGWQLVPWAGLALAVLVPVFLASAILDALDDAVFGLPWIALAVLLLLYSFGRGDLDQMQARYRMQCQNGDFEAAMHWIPRASGDAAATQLSSAQDVHYWAQRGLFYEAYQRWFAVLFYFVLAGPAFALAYRLVQLCRHRFDNAIVERTLLVLDWLPSRLLAATFAVTGDFVRSRGVLVDAVFDPGRAAGELIYAVGAAASGAAPDAPADTFSSSQAVVEHEEGADLIARSGVAWVAGLALLVLLFD
jgi:AmpE protein